MVMLLYSVARAPVLSATFTTDVRVPAAVGVQEMEAGYGDARRRSHEGNSARPR
jgi:hypothetical protein